MSSGSRAAMVPITRRVRAYFAPIDRATGTPALFDPGKYGAFPLDTPPAPWLDLGWIDNFQRVSLTPTEPLRAGIRGAAAAQFRGVLDAGLLVRYETLREKRERSKVWTDKQVARMQRGMALMAKELEGRTWCQGERYSLADIAVGCCIGWLGFRKPGELDWEAEYPGVARHYRKLLERAAFADSVPVAPK